MNHARHFIMTTLFILWGWPKAKRPWAVHSVAKLWWDTYCMVKRIDCSWSPAKRKLEWMFKFNA